MPHLLCDSSWLSSRVLQVRTDILQKGLLKGAALLEPGRKPLPDLQTIPMDKKGPNPHHIQTHVRLPAAQVQNLPITQRALTLQPRKVNDQVTTYRPPWRQTQHVPLPIVHSLRLHFCLRTGHRVETQLVAKFRNQCQEKYGIWCVWDWWGCW